MTDELDPDDPYSSRSRELPHSTALALVWRLSAELVRRYPDRLWVEPEGGGMYDRTTVVDLSAGQPQHVATFNALGSGMLVGPNVRRWTVAYADGAERSEWLGELARTAGLPPRASGLPASTPRSLVARYVAAFLALQIGARRDWIASPLSQFSDRASTIPAIDEWQGKHPDRSHHLVCIAERGASRPALALSVDGHLWSSSGGSFQLSNIHRPGAPVTALLLATAPELLP